MDFFLLHLNTFIWRNEFYCVKAFGITWLNLVKRFDYAIQRETNSMFLSSWSNIWLKCVSNTHKVNVFLCCHRFKTYNQIYTICSQRIINLNRFDVSLNSISVSQFNRISMPLNLDFLFAFCCSSLMTILDRKSCIFIVTSVRNTNLFFAKQ